VSGFKVVFYLTTHEPKKKRVPTIAPKNFGALNPKKIAPNTPLFASLAHFLSN
jgi:hypothetical protein